MEMQIIKLLNEYEKEKTNQNVRFWNYYQNGFHYLEDGQTYSELLMISKKYEFIKWLVENNKIDFESQAMKYVKSDLSKFFAEWEDRNGMSDDYVMLLMLLTIQDKPIDFLISILK